MPVGPDYRPSPVFLELGCGFAEVVVPARVPQHILRFRNQIWAERVGLGGLTDEEWRAHMAEFKPLPGNLEKHYALSYHGHQFRVYNPDLGDGRGFLFAQLKDKDDRLLDLGTKGSGQTPYSRGGDGRLTLKGGVREVLATEMLESLGVNTSKSFSLFETGEKLIRHDEPSPTRSSVLVRLSHSHIRFGTFQRLAVFRDEERMRKLLDYCLRYYFRSLSETTPEEQPAVFLREVVHRSARLCASWMIAGFVHGVLNTDNMNITGESFDYGPYRFLPKYDPGFTAAYFDETGLYAYGRQPEAVMWNLERLAAALLLVSTESALLPQLQEFIPAFNKAILELLTERLGLISRGEDRDEDLLLATFRFLEESQVPFEQFFHDWYGGMLSRERAMKSPVAAAYQGEAFENWRKVVQMYDAPAATVERLKDPYFQRSTPCSLLIDEIESIWDAIDTRDDWSKFEEKIEDIRHMGKVYGRRTV